MDILSRGCLGGRVGCVVVVVVLKVFLFFITGLDFWLRVVTLRWFSFGLEVFNFRGGRDSFGSFFGGI